MIDWKYGGYTLAWWLPVIIILSFTSYTIKGLPQLITLLVELAVILAINFFYERKHPQLKKSNRETTISHPRGICVCIFIVLFLAVPLFLPNFHATKFTFIFPLLFIVFSDLLTSFFSRAKKAFLS